MDSFLKCNSPATSRVVGSARHPVSIVQDRRGVYHVGVCGWNALRLWMRQVPWLIAIVVVILALLVSI